MDAREGYVAVRVVHDRATLVVGNVHDLGLKIEGTPAEFAGLVVEVAVDRSRVDDRHLANGRGLENGEEASKKSTPVWTVIRG